MNRPEYTGPNSRMFISTSSQPGCPLLLVTLIDREENTQLDIQLTPEDAEMFAALLVAAAFTTQMETNYTIESLLV